MRWHMQNAIFAKMETDPQFREDVKAEFKLYNEVLAEELEARKNAGRSDANVTADSDISKLTRVLSPVQQSASG